MRFFFDPKIVISDPETFRSKLREILEHYEKLGDVELLEVNGENYLVGGDIIAGKDEIVEIFDVLFTDLQLDTGYNINFVEVSENVKTYKYVVKCEFEPIAVQLMETLTEFENYLDEVMRRLSLKNILVVNYKFDYNYFEVKGCNIEIIGAYMTPNELKDVIYSILSFVFTNHTLTAPTFRELRITNFDYTFEATDIEYLVIKEPTLITFRMQVQKKDGGKLSSSELLTLQKLFLSKLKEVGKGWNFYIERVVNKYTDVNIVEMDVGFEPTKNAKDILLVINGETGVISGAITTIIILSIIAYIATITYFTISKVEVISKGPYAKQFFNTVIFAVIGLILLVSVGFIIYIIEKFKGGK